MSPPGILTTSSTIVYQNRWMTVREDAIVRADGSRGIYGVVDKPDFAVIAAVAGETIYLVEQYRYPVGSRCLELPQGSWEQSANVDPLALARAELREETGLTAGRIVHAGRLHEAYGYSTQAFDLFFASELTQGATQLEIEEQGLVCRPFSVSQVCEMICNGTITDAVTVASIGLLRLKAMI
jgi:ADP-ribose pyrophosphatase